MKFEELEVGSIFNYHGYSYTKIDKIYSIVNFFDGDSSCPARFVDRYLNHQYMAKHNIDAKDLLLLDDKKSEAEHPHYLRLMTVQEHDDVYKIIPKWLNQYVAQDLKTTFVYNITKGETKTVNQYYGGPIALRPILAFKSETEVDFVRVMNAGGIACCNCGKIIKDDEFEAIDTSCVLNNKAYCEKCFIDNVCPDLTDEEKFIVMKRAIDKASEQSYFRTGNKTWSFIHEQYDILKRQKAEQNKEAQR